MVLLAFLVDDWELFSFLASSEALQLILRRRKLEKERNNEWIERIEKES